MNISSSIPTPWQRNWAAVRNSEHFEKSFRPAFPKSIQK
jgi:hypothetical protein